MASYSIVFKRSVAKDFRAIPNKDITKILRRIESLANEPRPRGAEKLSGQDRCRVRQGIYRIIYEVSDNQLLVAVIKVAHRHGVYRSIR